MGGLFWTLLRILATSPGVVKCDEGNPEAGSILLIQVLKYQIIVTSCHRGFRKAVGDSPAHCSK